jgi:TRAP-type transport system periplasmic protein
MKRWTTCLALLLALSLLIGSLTACNNTSSTTQSSSSQTSTAGAPKVIKFGIGIPPGDPMVDGLQVWVDNFNAAAKGRYEAKLFPGGVLAGTMDTLDAVRTGAEEVGHGSITTFGGQDAGFSAAEVPYLLNSFDANVEFNKLIFDYHNSILEKKFHQKLLATWPMGFAEFYTVNRPVKTLADMKGLLVACDTVFEAKSSSALGASPVTMDFPEEIPSLQKGIVNAGMIAIAGGMAFMKYYDAVKYYVASSKSGSELDVTINLDVYNNMPPDLQKVMVDEGKKYADAMVPAMKNFSYTWALGELKKNGMDIYNLPAAERDNWKKACQPIIDEYWQKMGSDAQVLKEAAAQANAKYPYSDN